MSSFPPPRSSAGMRWSLPGIRRRIEPLVVARNRGRRIIKAIDGPVFAVEQGRVIAAFDEATWTVSTDPSQVFMTLLSCLRAGEVRLDSAAHTPWVPEVPNVHAPTVDAVVAELVRVAPELALKRAFESSKHRLVQLRIPPEDAAMICRASPEAVAWLHRLGAGERVGEIVGIADLPTHQRARLLTTLLVLGHATLDAKAA